jgi:Transposase DDE domain
MRASLVAPTGRVPCQTLPKPLLLIGSEIRGDFNWREGSRCSRDVREYLDALEESNPTAEDSPADQPEPPTPPKNISLTDPAARWTAATGRPAFFAYSTNYLIDLSAGIIVDVEATPAHRTQEVNSTRTMIDRVEQRMHLKPHRLVGVTAYGAAPMLAWMVEDKGIEPHVPMWDKTVRHDDSLSVVDFTWHEDRNEYHCPEGKPLRSEWRQFKNPRSRITKADTVIYRASQMDCDGCRTKDKCCPNTPFRKIARSIHEKARDVARSISKTAEYQQSRRDRKKVEMLFAHIKRILKLDRLRLRGLSGLAGCRHSVSTAAPNGSTTTGRSPVRIPDDRSTTWTGRSAGATGAKLGNGRSRCG